MIKELRDLRDSKMVKELVSDPKKTLKDLGEDYGMSSVNVHKVLKKSKSREIIKAETEKLLKLVPEITEQVKTDIKLGKKITNYLADPTKEKEFASTTSFESSKDMVKFLELVYKKQRDVMQASGIFPSHGTNVLIQQIYNNNCQQVLSPEVFKILGGLFKESDENVIDAEVIETKQLTGELEEDEKFELE